MNVPSLTFPPAACADLQLFNNVRTAAPPCTTGVNSQDMERSMAQLVLPACYTFLRPTCSQHYSTVPGLILTQLRLPFTHL